MLRTTIARHGQRLTPLALSIVLRTMGSVHRGPNRKVVFVGSGIVDPVSQKGFLIVNPLELDPAFYLGIFNFVMDYPRKNNNKIFFNFLES